MKFISAIISIFMFANGALASDKIVCDYYVIQDVPFATVELTVMADGRIDPTAKITHYGITKSSGVIQHETGADELYNLQVEADSPGNELGLVIFREQTSTGANRSVLINPNSPMGKEMRGQCAVTNT